MTKHKPKHISTKNYTISLLRLVATFFIVLCHFLQYYNNELAWWFNVGVHIFFCISGFLYANKRLGSPIDFICKNFKKIMVPYYSFLIPTILFYFLFARESINLSGILSALLCSGTIDGIGHLWFIPYILFCYLITPYLQAISDKIRATKWYVFLGLFFLLVLSAQVLSFAFDSYFLFSRIFSYLFGYFASVFLQEYKLHLFHALTWVLAVITILLNALRIYCKYIALFSFSFFSLFEQYSHSLLGISIVFVSLILIKNIRQSTVLDLSDKYSFYVYIVHQLFILSPFSLLKASNFLFINCFITIVAILFFAWLLRAISNIIERCLTTIFTLTKRKTCR